MSLVLVSSFSSSSGIAVCGDRFGFLIESEMLDDTLEMPMLMTPFGEIYPEAKFCIFEGVGSEKDDVGIPFKVIVCTAVPKFG